MLSLVVKCFHKIYNICPVKWWNWTQWRRQFFFFFETKAPVFCCHDGIVFSGESLDVQLCYGGFSLKKNSYVRYNCWCRFTLKFRHACTLLRWYLIILFSIFDLDMYHHLFSGYSSMLRYVINFRRGHNCTVHALTDGNGACTFIIFENICACTLCKVKLLQ
jgi:hypothetical protein